MKRLLCFVLALAASLFALWYYITVPVFFVASPESYQSLASADTLRRHVRTLSEELPSRSEDADELAASAGYIQAQFQQHTDRVEAQPYGVWGIEYQNISAKFGPDDDIAPVIVIGAHYDAFKGLPGADDNASGVAGLLELARLFAAQPPPIQVELVAYALEEPPYFRTDDMGSYHHAQSLREKGAEVRLMICLEMIGYFSEQAGSQRYPLARLNALYPDKANFIAVVSNLGGHSDVRALKTGMLQATPLPVESMLGPAFLAGVDFSDHINYWFHDYPAVMVTDTAFYRNRAYHTDQDTWDTLDYERMAMVVDGIFYSLVSNNTK
ncbi:M28 family peptidase [Hahella sp. HN01]|uniref:M28 family peptidase n=1 Tax=Hahella sp. HN01 TaxID=2847262 RepID=UPI001C1EE0F6|nr:M28 family peptidase [Hahella sp. HN01]MBU6950480.1 M28 family peptidase [Hahella sp. HN01]